MWFGEEKIRHSNTKFAKRSVIFQRLIVFWLIFSLLIPTGLFAAEMQPIPPVTVPPKSAPPETLPPSSFPPIPPLPPAVQLDLPPVTTPETLEKPSQIPPPFPPLAETISGTPLAESVPMTAPPTTLPQVSQPLRPPSPESLAE